MRRADLILDGMISTPPEDWPFQLTICGIPELGEHETAGVSHVLSILDPEIEDPAAFARFPSHSRLALRFHDIIDAEPGRVAPTRPDVEQLLAFGEELNDRPGSHLLVHCHAGASRSTASATLILLQACPDRPAVAALDAVVQTRPRAWPNLRILEYGDALLGRNGELVAAAAAVYRRAVERQPELAEIMIAAGRTREVAAARQEP